MEVGAGEERREEKKKADEDFVFYACLVRGRDAVTPSPQSI